MEYEEKKNEGEKEQDDEGAETPKEPEVKMEKKQSQKHHQFNLMNLQYYIHKGWRRRSMINNFQNF